MGDWRGFISKDTKEITGLMGDWRGLISKDTKEIKAACSVNSNIKNLMIDSVLKNNDF